MRDPSGENCGSLALPRWSNKRFAGDDPSIGTDQSCRARVNTTTSPLGEMTGFSPSPRDTGVPPANGTDHISTLLGSGMPSGLTGSASSKLDP